QIVIAPYQLVASWLTPLITGASAIVAAFVALEKWRKGKRESVEAK
ncbi:hypothetical protein LCGC14_2124710, partial [marine sediment metagenome]